MKDIKDILVLYHANCHDGFTAAWCAWKKYDDRADYIPVRYGEKLDIDVTGKDVLILDFSYPREVLEDLNAKTSRLLVLDHHVSAQRDLEGLPYAHFDMDRSGAGMAWDYFHPGLIRPRLVSYVEDRDLWRWKLTKSRELNAWIMSHPIGSFTQWDSLADDIGAITGAAVIAGEAILRNVETYVENMRRNAITRCVCGYAVPVVNAPMFNISELLECLAHSAAFAVGWCQRRDGLYQYSLRSRGDCDVSIIAKHHGGGGHAKAAGFASDRPPGELFDKDGVP